MILMFNALSQHHPNQPVAVTEQPSPDRRGLMLIRHHGAPRMA